MRFNKDVMIVFAELSKHENYILLSSIHEKIINEMSISKLDTVINHLDGKGLILMKYGSDVDANVYYDAPMYKLSGKALMLIENEIKTRFTKDKREKIGLSNPKNNIELKNGKLLPTNKISKPTFLPEAVANIFDILKCYFPKEQWKALKLILEKGTSPKSPLLFSNNGIQLAYVFKELKSGQLLFYTKNEILINWMMANFKYWYRNKEKEFTVSYLNKIISGSRKPSEGNRILSVENRIVKALTLTTREIY
jgi:hypothetical protein